MYIESYKELTVWQRAMEMVVSVYDVSKKLPKDEIYGLTSQMRRAAVSVPSNIAEGKKRKSKNDFLQFLRISSGSAAELETQLILMRDLYKIESDESLSLLNEVQKMLTVMVSKLEEKND